MERLYYSYEINKEAGNTIWLGHAVIGKEPVLPFQAEVQFVMETYEPVIQNTLNHFGYRPLKSEAFILFDEELFKYESYEEALTHISMVYNAGENIASIVDWQHKNGIHREVRDDASQSYNVGKFLDLGTLIKNLTELALSGVPLDTVVAIDNGQESWLSGWVKEDAGLVVVTSEDHDHIDNHLNLG